VFRTTGKVKCLGGYLHVKHSHECQNSTLHCREIISIIPFTCQCFKMFRLMTPPAVMTVYLCTTSQQQMCSSVLYLFLQVSLVQRTAAARALSLRSTAPHAVTSHLAPAQPSLPTPAWAKTLLLQTGRQPPTRNPVTS